MGLSRILVAQLVCACCLLQPLHAAAARGPVGGVPRPNDEPLRTMRTVKDSLNASQDPLRRLARQLRGFADRYGAEVESPVPADHHTFADQIGDATHTEVESSLPPTEPRFLVDRLDYVAQAFERTQPTEDAHRSMRTRMQHIIDQLATHRRDLRACVLACLRQQNVRGRIQRRRRVAVSDDADDSPDLLRTQAQTLCRKHDERVDACGQALDALKGRFQDYQEEYDLEKSDFNLISEIIAFLTATQLQLDEIKRAMHTAAHDIEEIDQELGTAGRDLARASLYAFDAGGIMDGLVNLVSSLVPGEPSGPDAMRGILAQSRERVLTIRQRVNSIVTNVATLAQRENKVLENIKTLAFVLDDHGDRHVPTLDFEKMERTIDGGFFASIARALVLEQLLPPPQTAEQTRQQGTPREVHLVPLPSVGGLARRALATLYPDLKNRAQHAGGGCDTQEGNRHDAQHDQATHTAASMVDTLRRGLDGLVPELPGHVLRHFQGLNGGADTRQYGPASWDDLYTRAVIATGNANYILYDIAACTRFRTGRYALRPKIEFIERLTGVSYREIMHTLADPATPLDQPRLIFWTPPWLVRGLECILHAATPGLAPSAQRAAHRDQHAHDEQRARPEQQTFLGALSASWREMKTRVAHWSNAVTAPIARQQCVINARNELTEQATRLYQRFLSKIHDHYFRSADLARWRSAPGSDLGPRFLAARFLRYLARTTIGAPIISSLEQRIADGKPASRELALIQSFVANNQLNVLTGPLKAAIYNNHEYIRAFARRYENVIQMDPITRLDPLTNRVTHAIKDDGLRAMVGSLSAVWRPSLREGQELRHEHTIVPPGGEGRHADDSDGTVPLIRRRRWQHRADSSVTPMRPGAVSATHPPDEDGLPPRSTP